MATLTSESDYRREAIPWRAFPFRGKRLLVWFVVLLSFVAVGSVVGSLILGPLASSVGDTDLTISEWMADQRSPHWNALTWWGSTLADSWVKIPLAVALVGFFVLRWKRGFEAALLAGALILESTAFVIMSFIVGRERPPIEQLDSIPPTGSFPSGHTAAAVVFYAAIALIVWANTSNRLARGLAVAAAVIVPPIVAVSRVYRGMHFTSDVIFGIVLGVASLAAVWWILTTRESFDEDHRAAPLSVVR